MNDQATRNPYEDYYLIQFSYPFPTEVRYRLEEAGMTFYDYAGVAAMYAKVPSQALDALQNAMMEKTVRYVGNIPTQAKVDPNLAAQAAPLRKNPYGQYLERLAKDRFES